MGEAKRKAETKVDATGRQVLSACIFQAELTSYNAEGEVCARPKLINFGFLEADIPEPTRAWLLGAARNAQAVAPDPAKEK